MALCSTNQHSVHKNISKFRQNVKIEQCFSQLNQQIVQIIKNYEQTIAIFFDNLYNWYNHRNGVMGEVPPFIEKGGVSSVLIHVLR